MLRIGDYAARLHFCPSSSLQDGVYTDVATRLPFAPYGAWRLRDSTYIFAFGENRGSNQCLHWLQELSTGQFLCYGFESLVETKKDTTQQGGVFFWWRLRDSNL